MLSRAGINADLFFGMGALLRTARSAVPTVEGENVWPFFGILHQTGANRIHPYVIRLFFKAFVSPESMVKKISLPRNAVLPDISSMLERLFPSLRRAEIR